MEAYIRKMVEIVKKHYEANHTSVHSNDVRLQSFNFVNGDVYATFHVGVVAMDLCMYEVIYFLEYDEFRVFCYKLAEHFDAHD